MFVRFAFGVVVFVLYSFPALAGDFEKFTPGSGVNSEEFTSIVKSFKNATAVSYNNNDTKFEFQLNSELVDPRIVGGTATTVEKYPWQVALLYGVVAEPQRVLRCGGSVIAPNWILTAAHCVADGTQEDAVSQATFYRVQGLRAKILKVIAHPQFNSDTLENDVALLKVDTALPDGSVVPIAAANIDIPDQSSVYVTGWGAIFEGGPTSEILRVAKMPLVANSVCNAPESYNDKIKSGMMCAGYRDGGLDSCQGDSGGPAVVMEDGKPLLAGVVSFGEGCARKLKYGVYTRVSSYADWIRQTITTQ